MSDELMKLCPIQFIEGLNEGAEPADRKHIRIDVYEAVAIEYTPAVTFCMTNVESFVVWGQSSAQQSFSLAVHSAYADNPSNLVLSRGNMVIDETAGGFGWRNVELDNPVVVFCGRTYWLVLEAAGAPLALGRTEEGKEITIRSKVRKEWGVFENDISPKLMIRFYGRVLPVSR